MVNATSMQGETLGSDNHVASLWVSLVVVTLPEWCLLMTCCCDSLFSVLWLKVLSSSQVDLQTVTYAFAGLTLPVAKRGPWCGSIYNSSCNNAGLSMEAQSLQYVQPPTSIWHVTLGLPVPDLYSPKG